MAVPKNFPIKESDFNASANVLIPYLGVSTVKTRLVLSPAAQAALTAAGPLLITYNGLNLQCQNSNLVTTTIISSRKTTRELIIAQLRIIYDDMPVSALTQTDRDTLNIPIRTYTRTPASVPTITPSIDVLTHDHLSIVLYFSDKTNIKSTSMPLGTKSIDMEFAYQTGTENGATFIPVESDYRHIGITNRTKYEFKYTQEFVKKEIYVRARYLNTLGEAGKWSNTMNINLI